MAQEAIFIGYRRDDTADVAGRLFDALARRFGRRRLFKDVDNLRPGADFGAHIRAILPRCRVFLALIGPNWAEARNERGDLRLHDPSDWVRLELEIALATPGLEVVPVLVNGAAMPPSQALPPSLQPLLLRHAAVVRRDPDFRDDAERLAAALRQSLTGAAPAPGRPGRGRMVWIAGATALAAVAAGGVWLSGRPLGASLQSPTAAISSDPSGAAVEAAPAVQEAGAASASVDADVGDTAAASPADRASPGPDAAAARVLASIPRSAWQTRSSRSLLDQVLEASSFESLSALADTGDARAQFLVGMAYWHGRGVAQDDARALRFLTRAAEQGQVNAQTNLGVMYERGRGVAQDYAQAREWFGRAARAGYATAQFNLAILTAGGRGAPADPAAAARLFRQAAEQGLAEAQYQLAVRYVDGDGVEPDAQEAVAWLRRAVAQGHILAQTELGVHYETGSGVPQDRDEAVRLYRLAARQGEETAQGNLRRLGESW